MVQEKVQGLSCRAMCYVPVDLLIIVVLSVSFLSFVFKFRSVFVCSVLHCTKAVLPIKTHLFSMRILMLAMFQLLINYLIKEPTLLLLHFTWTDQNHHV